MPWSRYFAASDEPGSPPPSWPVRAFNLTLAVLAVSFVFYYSSEGAKDTPQLAAGRNLQGKGKGV